jgi:hypothetical protein
MQEKLSFHCQLLSWSAKKCQAKIVTFPLDENEEKNTIWLPKILTFNNNEKQKLQIFPLIVLKLKASIDTTLLCKRILLDDKTLFRY